MCFAFINFEGKWELMYVISIHICENIIKKVERHGKFVLPIETLLFGYLFIHFFYIMRILVNLGL